jgi:hypothetical protein
MAMSGSLGKKQQLISSNRPFENKYLSVRRRQNAGGMAMSGSSGKQYLHIILLGKEVSSLLCLRFGGFADTVGIIRSSVESV